MKRVISVAGKTPSQLVREVEESGSEMISNTVVSAIIQSNSQRLRSWAKEGKLPFHHLEIGTSIKYPKDSFFNWLRQYKPGVFENE